MKNYIISGIVALIISLGVVGLVPQLLPKENAVKIEHINTTAMPGAVYTVNSNKEIVPLDFTGVADKVMDAVVHIKSSREVSNGNGYRQLPDPFRDFFFEDFFGQRRQYSPSPRARKPHLQVGSGSGVIINSDGYIVTNNHVIANANQIEVTLHDNKSYPATIVGTDPSTDLALLQIREKDLPILPLVNSDDVKIGEWVVAVGNPFNLNSTVTAGIVSAKSRNINILKEKYAVESFIQTDAAINPGNSGGALVNLQGGLIGINTAIASPTGAYAGYGFAVPSNIVNKVVEDLLKYGSVQRGYLGVTIRGVNGELAKEKNLKVDKGVYIDSLIENGAALDAGLEPGDVILEVEGSEVNSPSQLQEMIARKRPGDKIIMKIARGSREFTTNAQLKNQDGNTNFLAENREEIFNMLGAEFKTLDSDEVNSLNIEGGVRIEKLYAGVLTRDTKIREGFIITKVDKVKVKNLSELKDVLRNKSGGILFEGFYEDLPGRRYYAFGLSQ